MEELLRVFSAFFVDKKIADKSGSKMGNWKLLLLILVLMVLFTYIYETFIKN